MQTKLLLDTTDATGQAKAAGIFLDAARRKLGTILRSWLMAVARWRRIRRAIQEVAQHDDRMLKDIGIHRSEIERAVRCGRAR
jgi:uncharacterized protein YjiS (DUF1127 family)